MEYHWTKAQHKTGVGIKAAVCKGKNEQCSHIPDRFAAKRERFAAHVQSNDGTRHSVDEVKSSQHCIELPKDLKKRRLTESQQDLNDVERVTQGLAFLNHSSLDLNESLTNNQDISEKMKNEYAWTEWQLRSTGCNNVEVFNSFGQFTHYVTQARQAVNKETLRIINIDKRDHELALANIFKEDCEVRASKLPQWVDEICKKALYRGSTVSTRYLLHRTKEAIQSENNKQDYSKPDIPLRHFHRQLKSVHSTFHDRGNEEKAYKVRHMFSNIHESHQKTKKRRLKKYSSRPKRRSSKGDAYRHSSKAESWSEESPLVAPSSKRGRSRETNSPLSMNVKLPCMKITIPLIRDTAIGENQTFSSSTIEVEEAGDPQLTSDVTCDGEILLVSESMQERNRSSSVEDIPDLMQTCTNEAERLSSFKQEKMHVQISDNSFESKIQDDLPKQKEVSSHNEEETDGHHLEQPLTVLSNNHEGVFEDTTECAILGEEEYDEVNTNFIIESVESLSPQWREQNRKERSCSPAEIPQKENIHTSSSDGSTAITNCINGRLHTGIGNGIKDSPMPPEVLACLDAMESIITIVCDLELRRSPGGRDTESMFLTNQKSENRFEQTHENLSLTQDIKTIFKEHELSEQSIERNNFSHVLSKPNVNKRQLLKAAICDSSTHQGTQKEVILKSQISNANDRKISDVSENRYDLNFCHFPQSQEVIINKNDVDRGPTNILKNANGLQAIQSSIIDGLDVPEETASYTIEKDNFEDSAYVSSTSKEESSEVTSTSRGDAPQSEVVSKDSQQITSTWKDVVEEGALVICESTTVSKHPEPYENNTSADDTKSEESNNFKQKVSSDFGDVENNSLLDTNNINNNDDRTKSENTWLVTAVSENVEKDEVDCLQKLKFKRVPTSVHRQSKTTVNKFPVDQFDEDSTDTHSKADSLCKNIETSDKFPNTDIMPTTEMTVSIMSEKQKLNISFDNSDNSDKQNKYEDDDIAIYQNRGEKSLNKRPINIQFEKSDGNDETMQKIEKNARKSKDVDSETQYEKTSQSEHCENLRKQVNRNYTDKSKEIVEHGDTYQESVPTGSSHEAIDSERCEVNPEVGVSVSEELNNLSLTETRQQCSDKHNVPSDSSTEVTSNSDNEDIWSVRTKSGKMVKFSASKFTVGVPKQGGVVGESTSGPEKTKDDPLSKTKRRTKPKIDKQHSKRRKKENSAVAEPSSPPLCSRLQLELPQHNWLENKLKESVKDANERKQLSPVQEIAKEKHVVKHVRNEVEHNVEESASSNGTSITTEDENDDAASNISVAHLEDVHKQKNNSTDIAVSIESVVSGSSMDKEGWYQQKRRDSDILYQSAKQAGIEFVNTPKPTQTMSSASNSPLGALPRSVERLEAETPGGSEAVECEGGSCAAASRRCEEEGGLAPDPNHSTHTTAYPQPPEDTLPQMSGAAGATSTSHAAAPTESQASPDNRAMSDVRQSDCAAHFGSRREAHGGHGYEVQRETDFISSQDPQAPVEAGGSAAVQSNPSTSEPQQQQAQGHSSAVLSSYSPVHGSSAVTAIVANGAQPQSVINRCIYQAYAADQPTAAAAAANTDQPSMAHGVALCNKQMEYREQLLAATTTAAAATAVQEQNNKHINPTASARNSNTCDINMSNHQRSDVVPAIVADACQQQLTYGHTRPSVSHSNNIAHPVQTLAARIPGNDAEIYRAKETYPHNRIQPFGQKATDISIHSVTPGTKSALDYELEKHQEEYRQLQYTEARIEKEMEYIRYLKIEKARILEDLELRRQKSLYSQQCVISDISSQSKSRENSISSMTSGYMEGGTGARRDVQPENHIAALHQDPHDVQSAADTQQVSQQQDNYDKSMQKMSGQREQQPPRVDHLNQARLMHDRDNHARQLALQQQQYLYKVTQQQQQKQQQQHHQQQLQQHQQQLQQHQQQLYNTYSSQSNQNHQYTSKQQYVIYDVKTNPYESHPSQIATQSHQQQRPKHSQEQHNIQNKITQHSGFLQDQQNQVHAANHQIGSHHQSQIYESQKHNPLMQIQHNQRALAEQQHRLKYDEYYNYRLTHGQCHTQETPQQQSTNGYQQQHNPKHMNHCDFQLTPANYRPQEEHSLNAKKSNVDDTGQKCGTVSQDTARSVEQMQKQRVQQLHQEVTQQVNNQQPYSIEQQRHEKLSKKSLGTHSHIPNVNMFPTETQPITKVKKTDKTLAQRHDRNVVERGSDTARINTGTKDKPKGTRMKSNQDAAEAAAQDQIKHCLNIQRAKSKVQSPGATSQEKDSRVERSEEAKLPRMEQVSLHKGLTNYMQMPYNQSPAEHSNVSEPSPNRKSNSADPLVFPRSSQDQAVDENVATAHRVYWNLDSQLIHGTSETGSLPTRLSNIKIAPKKVRDTGYNAGKGASPTDGTAESKMLESKLAENECQVILVENPAAILQSEKEISMNASSVMTSNRSIDSSRQMLQYSEVARQAPSGKSSLSEHDAQQLLRTNHSTNDNGQRTGSEASVASSAYSHKDSDLTLENKESMRDECEVSSVQSHSSAERARAHRSSHTGGTPLNNCAKSTNESSRERKGDYYASVIQQRESTNSPKSRNQQHAQLMMDHQAAINRYTHQTTTMLTENRYHPSQEPLMNRLLPNEQQTNKYYDMQREVTAYYEQNVSAAMKQHRYTKDSQNNLLPNQTELQQEQQRILSMGKHNIKALELKTKSNDSTSWQDKKHAGSQGIHSATSNDGRPAVSHYNEFNKYVSHNVNSSQHNSNKTTVPQSTLQSNKYESAATLNQPRPKHVVDRVVLEEDTPSTHRDSYSGRYKDSTNPNFNNTNTTNVPVTGSFVTSQHVQPPTTATTAMFPRDRSTAAAHMPPYAPHQMAYVQGAGVTSAVRGPLRTQPPVASAGGPSYQQANMRWHTKELSQASLADVGTSRVGRDVGNEHIRSTTLPLQQITEGKGAHFEQKQTGKYQPTNSAKPCAEVSEAAANVVKYLCVTCKRQAAFLCSGCHRVWYCDVKCQTADWLEHSKVCVSKTS